MTPTDPATPAASSTSNLYRAVIVRDLAEAHQALALGLPVTLLSQRGAALFAGCQFWRALVRQVCAAHPNTPVQDVLDCADASGYAVAAMRIGQQIIVLDPDAPGRDAVVAIARERSFLVLDQRPPALDLMDRSAARRVEWWLGGHDM